MLYEVWINIYDTFTSIIEYAVFAGGHFEKSFYVQKYHKSYLKMLVLEDHGRGVHASLLYMPD